MGSGVADTLRVPRRDAGIVGSGISNLQRQNAGPSACLSLCLSNKYRNLTNTVLYQDLVGKLRAGLELSSIPGSVAHILAASLDIYLCVCVCVRGAQPVQLYILVPYYGRASGAWGF